MICRVQGLGAAGEGKGESQELQGAFLLDTHLACDGKCTKGGGCGPVEAERGVEEAVDDEL